MHNTECTNISVQELAAEALSNLAPAEPEQYVVRHSYHAARDFPPLAENVPDPEQEPNIWEQSYPVLFPYGEGGLERCHAQPLSLQDHVKWALQYHDCRFRTHPTFAFMAFGILQRRQALRSACMHLKGADFDRLANSLSTLTAQDLAEAAEQERRNQPIMNRAVLDL